MPTSPLPVASSGSTAPARIDLSLRRLSAGLRSASVARGSDAVDAQSRSDHALARVSGLLDDLSRLALGARTDPAGVQTQQDQLDGILAQINEISDAAAPGRGVGFSIDDRSPEVTRAGLFFPDLEPGQVVPINIKVTLSAQQGGLYLSTGGSLDLSGGVGSAFAIQIGTGIGTQTFAFASGTTLNQIAASINTFTDRTGAVADQLSGRSGLRIASTGFGDSQFVSVNVINAAHISGAGVGIYSLAGDDFNRPDDSMLISFQSTQAAFGVEDRGQDIEGFINEGRAITDGLSLIAKTSIGRVVADLRPGTPIDPQGVNAQNLGTFHAFTIVADGPGAPEGAQSGSNSTEQGPGAEAAPPVREPETERASVESITRLAGRMVLDAVGARTDGALAPDQAQQIIESLTRQSTRGSPGVFLNRINALRTLDLIRGRATRRAR